MRYRNELIANEAAGKGAEADLKDDKDESEKV